MPVTGESVRWVDIYSEDIGTASFLPMVLDVAGGIACVVATPMGCLSYKKWGRPNPPYVVFKHEDEEWKRISLQELPEEIKTPNIIFGSPGNHVKKLAVYSVKVEEIQKINSNGAGSVHVREALCHNRSRQWLARSKGAVNRRLLVEHGWPFVENDIVE